MKHINDNSLNTAGGIVLSNNKVLFIIKNDIWDLPKGKIGLNRTKLKTAKQEIHEETGLRKKDLNTIKKLVPTYYFKNISGDSFDNIVHQAKLVNPWFTHEHVKNSFSSLSKLLNEDNLRNWI